MSVHKARVKAIWLKIELLRARRPYRDVLEADCVGCFETIRRYEAGTRELCNEVEGLLREVEREEQRAEERAR